MHALFVILFIIIRAARNRAIIHCKKRSKINRRPTKPLLAFVQICVEMYKPIVSMQTRDVAIMGRIRLVLICILRHLASYWFL